jgi:hypothetical protein
LRAHPYGALPIKGWKEKIRKDHIKALDKGDLVLIIFGMPQSMWIQKNVK